MLRRCRRAPPEIVWGTAATPGCPTEPPRAESPARSAAPLLVEDWEWSEVVLIDARCSGLLREQTRPVTHSLSQTQTPFNGWLQRMHVHLLLGIQSNNVDAMRRAEESVRRQLRLETTQWGGGRLGEALSFVVPPRRCCPISLPVYVIPRIDERDARRAQGATTPRCCLKECVLVCTRLANLVRRLEAFQVHPTYFHLGIDDPSRVHGNISLAAARLSSMLRVLRRYIHLVHSLVDQHRASWRGARSSVASSLIQWATRY